MTFVDHTKKRPSMAFVVIRYQRREKLNSRVHNPLDTMYNVLVGCEILSQLGKNTHVDKSVGIVTNKPSYYSEYALCAFPFAYGRCVVVALYSSLVQRVIQNWIITSPKRMTGISKLRSLFFCEYNWLFVSCRFEVCFLKFYQRACLRTWRDETFLAATCFSSHNTGQ